MSKNDTITVMANKEVQIQFRATEEYREDLKREIAEAHLGDMSAGIRFALNNTFPRLAKKEKARMLAEFDAKNKGALRRILGRDDD